MTTSVTPIAATRLLKTEPYEASVAQQKARSCVPRERFNYLLRKPRCPRMLCNIAPHNLSATVSQDAHDVERSKRGRHRDEYIDGGDADCFVAQEATPRGQRRSDSSRHVLCDRGLADLDTVPRFGPKRPPPTTSGRRPA